MTIQEKIWMDELHQDLLETGELQDTMTDEELCELVKIHGEE